MSEHSIQARAIYYGVYEINGARLDLSEEGVRGMLERSPLPIPVSIEFGAIVGMANHVVKWDNGIDIVFEVDGGLEGLSAARKYKMAAPGIKYDLAIGESDARIVEFSLTNRPLMPIDKIKMITPSGDSAE